LPYWAALLILLGAAILEAVGDALMRKGIFSDALGGRSLLMLFGGLVLAAYGYVVNVPPWDFGRLLGGYVAILFAVAQVTAWVVFGQKPTVAVLVGGILIIAGGLVVSLGK
jgi:drug/metabolite transporter superfamily protein YnfA